mgnify:CR=1 FL=1
MVPTGSSTKVMTASDSLALMVINYNDPAGTPPCIVTKYELFSDAAATLIYSNSQVTKSGPLTEMTIDIGTSVTEKIFYQKATTRGLITGVRKIVVEHQGTTDYVDQSTV